MPSNPTLESPPKHSVDDLAIFGGQPAFDQALHVGRPNIGDRARLLERINDILDRRWFTNHGPYVRSFERRIEQLIGVRHCVATCNATTALQIAIQALGLSGEVIVPSFTFVATAHALEWLGLSPVFCDIDARTCTIDAGSVEQRITARTSAILGVHLWGRSCNVAALEDIASRRGLKLFFDAAHAFGCSHRGRMVGTFGEAEIFSFHATKFVNSFEGGAVVTNNDALAERVRLMANFGFERPDTVVMRGTNGKMNEVSAAMGLTSLESMTDFVAANRANYEAYCQNLGGIAGIRMVPYDHTESTNYQYVVVEIDATAIGLARDELASILWHENVLARRYYFPGCHRMEPYRSRTENEGATLPVTEEMTSRVLSLPNGTAIGLSEVERIASIIRFCAERSADIRARLVGQADTGIVWRGEVDLSRDGGQA